MVTFDPRGNGKSDRPTDPGAYDDSQYVTDRCLRECRHPGPFLLRHYRRGPGAALELGLSHGLFCLGCCWALMLLMFAVGVANLTWMAVLTALMVYEKTGRLGEWVARYAGVTFLLMAVVVALTGSGF